MNNLHRELAPISDSAWAQIEEETSRTLKRYLAGRRVVDLKGPAGTALSAVGTGHLRTIAGPAKGILASQREVKALVELRVPFELDRRAIDDVDRGASDSDWQPAKDAARQIAFAEDTTIFEGYAAAGIGGIRQGTSNPIMTLPADVSEYPDAISQSLSRLRLVGVNGPYAVLLGADAYTALAETSDHGYPVLEHVKRLVKDQIIWALSYLPPVAAISTCTSDRTSPSVTSATPMPRSACTCRRHSLFFYSPTKRPSHWLLLRRRRRFEALLGLRSFQKLRQVEGEGVK
jgi:uncharacterized linocin/CFP29 family protein